MIHVEVRHTSALYLKGKLINNTQITNSVLFSKKKKPTATKKATIRLKKLEVYLLRHSQYLSLIKLQRRNQRFIKQLSEIFENEEYSKSILNNKNELNKLVKRINTRVVEASCEEKIDNHMYIQSWKCEAKSKSDHLNEKFEFCSCFYEYTCWDYEDFSISLPQVNTSSSESFIQKTIDNYVKNCEEKINSLTEVQWNCMLEQEAVEKDNEKIMDHQCYCKREKSCEFQKIVLI